MVKYKYNFEDEEAFKIYLKKYLESRKELMELRKSYRKGDCNRREVGERIKELTSDMVTMLEIVQHDLLYVNYYGTQYSMLDHISDVDKIIEVMLRLLNSDIEKYSLVKYNAYIKESDGQIIKTDLSIIGEKDILTKFSNQKEYRNKLLKRQLTKIINSGHSLLTICEFEYKHDLLPYESNVKCDNAEKLDTYGPKHIYYYTYNDEINDVINKIKKYVDIYSANIDDMDVDTIIDRIKVKQLQKVNKVD